MFDRLAQLEVELEELEASLSDVYASGDRNASAAAGRRHAELRAIVDVSREHRRVSSELADVAELLAGESDPAAKEQWRAELESLERRKDALEERLRELMAPRDPDAGRNVLLEIRGAEGGEEANLWAADLFRMYQRLAERSGWKWEVLDQQPSDMGGIREVSFVVKGADAWTRLKHEAGPHRVQRVPMTESQGRVHTSAATVAVLPEAEEIDVAIDPGDLEVDVFRARGPGGQSVNTTDSAVRVTHTPTGIVVSCQDEKSQLQNKEKALRILRSRIMALERERQEEEVASARRDQVKSGGRSEKIRTYNFKENRVTDHRVGVTVHSLEQVLDGQLDTIVDALVAADQAEDLG